MNRRHIVRTTIATAALTLMAATADAEAGTYTVHTCKTPTGGSAGVSDWRHEVHAGSVDKTGSKCPGGPLWLDMLGSSSHSWDDYIHATFTAPADTTIGAYTFWRSVWLADGYNYRYYESTSAGWVQYDTCYPARGCTYKGRHQDPFIAANRVSVSGRTDVKALQFSLTCALNDGSGSCPAAEPGATFQLHRADITLVDNASPVIDPQPTGPLVEPGRRHAGVVPVSLSASDRGGGVHEALFEVDGRVVARATLDANDGACSKPFTRKVPCKLSASNTVGFDTSIVPDGVHSLRILISDAASNVAVWGPVSIQTVNASCRPFPRVGGLRMKARVSRRRAGASRRAVTTRYGGRVRVRGRLLTERGAPVPGAAVCIAARDARAGARVRPFRALTTNAAGRFSTILRRGPSRRVYFVHRVPRGAIASSVAVRVRAPVRLRQPRRSFRNGERLVLAGRLAGRPRPRRGVVVELQARRGRSWQTFGTTRTRRGGRFSFGYRFTRTSGVQRYQLRAFVPRQSIYPFAAGGSRPAIVRVVG